MECEECKKKDYTIEVLKELGKDVERHFLNDLGQEIVRINTENGWNVLKKEEWEDTYKIPAILMLVVSEAAEALEWFRKGDKENFKEECADVIIRMLDMTTGLGIDIDEEIRKKLEKNKTRGYRHGGKKV